MSCLSQVGQTVSWVVLGPPEMGSLNQLLGTSDAGVTRDKVGF